MRQILAAEAILVFLNILCYSDWLWMIPLQAFLYPLCIEWEKHRKRRLGRKYSEGFQEVLQSLMTSIQTGYTMENACRAVLSELEEQGERREKDPTVAQIRKIVYGLDLGIPVDQLFMQYAEETGIDDIRDFAGVLEIVKVTGGNLVVILKKTMDDFRRKMDTEEEVRTILSGVNYEKNIMLCMPLLVFAYMRFTNHAYMSCLYETMAGHVLMTFVLAAVLLCYYWTESMIHIRV